MKFHEDDLVMVIHPDYPELHGLAMVIKAPPEIVVVWSYLFVDNSERWFHVEFLRHATDGEKEEQLTKANCSAQGKEEE
ncbi:hypothetical protein AAIE21_01110 [Paenibacillus sp. 102]|uniref:hypothetical protein n=1 Tax=Paenibacillus sp. 102 TaxID=3120823 RepID=UPI0031BB4789